MQLFRLFALMLVLSNLIACFDNKQPKPKTVIIPVDTSNNLKIRKQNFTVLNKIDTSSFSVDFFTQLPSSISDSSGEFYTYDTTKLIDKKYIFLSDLATFAVVKINGAEIYLVKDYQKSVETSKNTFRDVYLGNGYTVLLTLHLIKYLGDGKSYNGGKLEVQNSKYKLSFKVHGNSKV
ncbi:MAG: hypothetical protein JWR61_1112 [Ferruginibacter sp.]|uniref:hypothetical protein n=1 Tax=Ferruginibacter sp. TaxID=1940288 RepID=UPI00265AF389|nr:hypothetical protein [Ferruginibacter sp.]MDB5276157.1 hypothetical protein [Ferruginibacter sp.]